MKLLKNPLVLAILILFLANVALFWKFYFKGLLPFPGDLLVSYYFPWNSGGFAGFDPWTTRKGVIAMDVIRQMFPWKSLVIDQIKSGQWPLWNPYNFSGTPLLANLQSSVFFPGNFVFFILPKIWAWISLVIGLPLIFGFFSYLFFRSLKLSNFAAIFGAIAISNIGFLTMWTEQLIVIQSVIFLPLILAILNWKRFFWFIPLLLAFSFFGGHPQTVAYVYIITFFYAIHKKIPLIKIFFVFIVSLGLSAIQLFPSLELYKYSSRESLAQKQFILTTALPWSHLATIFAPDFFGNPATFNFRGINYDNFQAYFGIAAVFLSLLGLFKKEARFFAILGITALLFALPPFAYLPVWLSIPILSSGFPSRIIFIFGFAFSILATFGFESISRTSSKKPLIFLTMIYSALIVSTFFFSKSDQVISLKNMLLPLIIFVPVSLIIYKFKKFAVLIIFFAIFEYVYFFNKYQPFSQQKFVFPNHPVFNFLQSIGTDRYFGVDRAYIDSNFATYYRIYTPEGYDPLNISAYSKLLAYPKTPSPSDAFLTSESQYRNKLFDILGVRYLVDKTDEPEKDFGPNEDRFSPKDYNFVQQVNKWKFYERKSSFPRPFLAGSYVVKTDREAIETFYDPNFNIRTLILNEKPSVEPFEDQKGESNIISYTPNRLEIRTNSLSPKLLFLSDNYYPGWKAYVDGKETKILRADYTFRAIALEKGAHQVIFEYKPETLYYGIVVSLVSLAILGLCLKKFS